MLQQYTQPLPRTLPPAPTLEQVIDVVNNNGDRIQSLYTNQASLSVAGVPFPLRAMVMYERPKNFRLKADTAMTGPELDVGSNGQLFWFWAKRNQPPALYFCRHEQFAASTAQIMPVEPDWLPRALGVITFEPGLPHQGPFPVGTGRLEIRTPPTTPNGNTRMTIVDESRGIVLEEHVYDSKGSLLASSRMSRHKHDASTGTTMPQHVEIQLPTMHMDFGIDLNELQINSIVSGQTDQWTMPSIPGVAAVDLADPNLRLVPPPTATGPPRVPAAQVRY